MTSASFVELCFARQQEPRFHDGNLDEFIDWVASNLQYPPVDNPKLYGLSLPVYFDIESDGSVSNVNLSRDFRLPPGAKPLSEEAIRVVMSTPVWAATDSRERYRIDVDYSIIDEWGLRKTPYFIKNEDGGDYSHSASVENWLEEQLDIPDDFSVSLVAVIEKGGCISNIEVLSTSDDQIAADVVDALGSAPKWTPGRVDLDPVRTLIRLPLRFGDDGPIKDIDAVDGAVPPSFKGGDVNDFREWVEARVLYPDELIKHGIEGNVMVPFVVNSDGKLEIDEQNISSPHELLTKEALRVIGNAKKWKPGTVDGEAVSIHYMLPVHFFAP